jgi:hypothetical protein
MSVVVIDLQHEQIFKITSPFLLDHGMRIILAHERCVGYVDETVDKRP